MFFRNNEIVSYHYQINSSMKYYDEALFCVNGKTSHMLDNRIARKSGLAMKTAYRKSELVAAVITVQSCSTNQYASGCGIFNPQYLMHIVLLSTFIDVMVIRSGKKC